MKRKEKKYRNSLKQCHTKYLPQLSSTVLTRNIILKSIPMHCYISMGKLMTQIANGIFTKPSIISVSTLMFQSYYIYPILHYCPNDHDPHVIIRLAEVSHFLKHLGHLSLSLSILNIFMCQFGGSSPMSIPANVTKSTRHQSGGARPPSASTGITSRNIVFSGKLSK